MAFGFLGSIFGTQKAIDNVIDKDNGLLTQLGTGIGNLHYSDQEKAQTGLKVMDFALQRLKALEPFKVVQRILAFIIAFNWLLVSISCLAAIWVEAIYPTIKIWDRMFAFATSDFVFWPVVSVLALYFTGGVVESIKSKLG